MSQPSNWTRRETVRKGAVASGALLLGGASITGSTAAGPPGVNAEGRCDSFGGIDLYVENLSNHTVRILVDGERRISSIDTGRDVTVSLFGEDGGDRVLVQAEKVKNSPSINGRGNRVPVNGEKDGDVLTLPFCPE